MIFLLAAPYKRFWFEGLVSQCYAVIRTHTRGLVHALLGSMNHVSITVSDLTDAMRFFKPFLEFLGYNIWNVIRDPNGQRLRVTVNASNGAVFNVCEAKPQFAKHPFEV